MAIEKALRKKLKELKAQARTTVETAKQNRWKTRLGQPPRKGPPGTHTGIT
jgi:hypothetical protein